MPFQVCQNVELSVNGGEAPAPIGMYGIGNVVEYETPKNSGGNAAFRRYGPSDFEIRLPVTTFRTLNDIANDQTKMLESHSMTVRFPDANGDPVMTANLTDVKFTSITLEIGDDGRPYLCVVGTCTQTVI